MYIQDNRKLPFSKADPGFQFEYDNNYYVKLDEKNAVSYSEHTVKPFSDETIIGFDNYICFVEKGKTTFDKILTGEFFSTYDVFLKAGDKGIILETGEIRKFSPEDEVYEIKSEMYIPD